MGASPPSAASLRTVALVLAVLAYRRRLGSGIIGAGRICWPTSGRHRRGSAPTPIGGHPSTGSSTPA